MESNGRPSKRQRVARACTNCRRRKARCDSQQPCEPCQISKLACSYEDNGRMTSTEYIQSLERKVSELEGLLGRPGPGPSRSQSRSQSLQTSPEKSRGHSNSYDHNPGSDDDMIETMLDPGDDDEDTHSHNFTHDGADAQERDPAGFGGLSLLRRVHRLCKHVSGSKQGGNSKPQNDNDDDLVNAFDVSPPESDAPISWEAFALLPSRSTIDKAIDVAVNQACCNMQFLDAKYLGELADEVFKEIEADSTDRPRKPLALLYAVLALSRQHNQHVPAIKEKKRPATWNGLRYFRASRTLLDPANCHDVLSLRTLLCMILYTGSASMITTCYSYICMAVAAALQMGLFTDLTYKDLSEEDKRTRRVIFSVLSIMDTYVTTSLGLPRTLRDIESSRSLPSIAKPDDVHDPMFGTYLHAQLIQILALTVETNHPFTRPIETKNGFYGVEYSKIVATEERLETWFEQLIETPADDQSAEDANLMRSQLMLRLYYAHVQMVLYRPFLHHALRDNRPGSHTSLKAYACGSACIKAAMQAVWLVERLEASGLFNPAQWYIVFIVTFTAACLTLFVTSNHGVPTVNETADAVRRIKEVCSRHAHENESLKRCLNLLESLPPNVPQDNTDDIWSSFAENTSEFAEAFHLPEHAPEPGDDMLQALHLPQLRSFLNCRL